MFGGETTRSQMEQISGAGSLVGCSPTHSLYLTYVHKRANGSAELVNQRAQHVVRRESSPQEMLLNGEKEDTNL